MKRKPMQSRLGIASQQEVITWNYFRSISQDRMLMLPPLTDIFSGLTAIQ